MLENQNWTLWVDVRFERAREELGQICIFKSSLSLMDWKGKGSYCHSPQREDQCLN